MCVELNLSFEDSLQSKSRANVCKHLSYVLPQVCLVILPESFHFEPFCLSQMQLFPLPHFLRSVVYQQSSKESATLQPFFTLQLDIQSDKIRTVQDALESLVARESVQGYTTKTKQEVGSFLCLVNVLQRSASVHLRYAFGVVSDYPNVQSFFVLLGPWFISIQCCLLCPW